MKFFTIAAFREDLEKYSKDKLIKLCKEDLCAFFQDQTITQIASRPILLSSNQSFQYMKSRIKNSMTGKGKSSSYRLYYYVDTKSENVYLLGFYPKTGAYGREDLSKTEEKLMIQAFADERKKGILVEHDVNDNFKVVEPEINQENLTTQSKRSFPNK